MRFKDFYCLDEGMIPDWVAKLSDDQLNYYEKEHPELERTTKNAIFLEKINRKNKVKKTLKLSPIQQKIFDVCEPLIIHIQNQAEAYYEKLLTEFKKFQETTPKNTMMAWSKYVDHFTHNPDTKQFIYSSYHQENQFSPVVFSQERKNYFIKRTKEDIRDFNSAKLSNALQQYITSDFKDISNIQLSSGSKGFEISANLTDNKNNNWNFKTQAIGAGGYNVQVWHYRYLVNLSSPTVSTKDVKEKVAKQNQEDKQLAQEEKQKVKELKDKLVAAKQIATTFVELKNDVKEWAERRAYTNWSKEEIEKEDNNIKRIENFLSKYNYKRPELTQMAADDKLSWNTFDEIGDILMKNSYYGLNYQYAKRREGKS